MTCACQTFCVCYDPVARLGKLLREPDRSELLKFLPSEDGVKAIEAVFRRMSHAEKAVADLTFRDMMR